jgi:hypothetical protein
MLRPTRWPGPAELEKPIHSEVCNMDVGVRAGVLRSFVSLPDPRMKRTRKHELPDLIAIAICAIICGADGWAQVAEFGHAKRKWFETFLHLPNGIPSFSHGSIPPRSSGLSSTGWTRW